MSRINKPFLRFCRLLSGIGLILCITQLSNAAGLEELAPLLAPASGQRLEQIYFEVKQKTEEKLNAILSIPTDQKTFYNTVLAIENAKAELDLVITIVRVHSRYNRRKIIQKSAIIIDEDYARFENIFSNNIKSKESLRQAVHNTKLLTNEERALVNQYFEQFDIQMQNSKKNNIIKKESEIELRLLQLAAQFKGNLKRNPVISFFKKDLEGLDADQLTVFNQITHSGKVRYSVDINVYLQGAYGIVMNYAALEKSRKKAWRAEQRIAIENKKILNEIFLLRKEQSELNGNASYSEWIHGKKELKSIYYFIDQLMRAIRPSIQADNRALLQFMQKVDPKIKKIMPWDRAYYTRLLYEEQYGLAAKKISEYYSIGVSIAGSFSNRRRTFKCSYRRNSRIPRFFRASKVL